MKNAIFTWGTSPKITVGVAEAPPAPRQRFVSAAAAPALLEKDIATAEALGLRFLAGSPGDPDASYLLGAALRRQGRLVEARALLEPLTESQPQMTRAWYELGALLRQLGEKDKATQSLLRAIDFEWMHKQAWYALGDVLPFPPLPGGEDSTLVEVEQALRENRFIDAGPALEARLAARSVDVQSLKLAADLALHTGRWGEFEARIRRCLEVAPDYVAARFRYATALFAQRQFEQSLPHIEELLKADPQNLLYRTLKMLVLSRRPDTRLSAFEEMMDQSEVRPGLWLLYGRMLLVMRDPKAAAAHRQALALLPSYADAYLSLTNLKSYRLDEEAIASIRMQLARPH
ncbi:MAG: tetratricopeptide repeat protein, partial [Alphaproteobacteria bacterium]|nr:tetratricopeptide repeat protein [Alphaproteobacteria bacterium]